ncbi:lysozyme inhibitor LprI family protein [Microcoleus sp. LEGE 07076]|uniref:lysozyme inhibitor LprI family protein n=1 Tax=Microcoleus sp. LEGE 07076 TaxID=915322 RepID=UPI001D1509FA|nr:lysozyme inhibitor LprI family protein [Microcoleus sp. LEGE 07076]
MNLPKLLLGTSLSLATFIGLSATSAIATNHTNFPETYVTQQPNCKNPQTQTELNICSGVDYQQEDKQLNQVYNQVRDQLSANRRQQLIVAQRAWISFRDGNCKFAKSEVEGGTMAPLIFNNCLQDTTKKRISELNSYEQNQMPQPNGSNYQTVDRKLNQVYQNTMGTLPASRQSQLKIAQRAWIVFRDANSKFESSLSNGSTQLSLIRMTEQRTKDLINLSRESR